MYDYPALQKCQLFKEMGQDIPQVLRCLNTRVIEYAKGDFVVLEGDRIDSFGIVLTGRVMILKEDINGNVTIINELTNGDTFGESFVCSGVGESLVSVQAAEKCEIMHIDYRKIVTVCSEVCNYHLKLVKNIIELIAKKNIYLNQKIEITSKKTIKEKLMAYFEMRSKETKSRKFDIPFNRTNLAFFIGVDRSSMTRELHNMQDAGLIRYNKNDFELLHTNSILKLE